ncbi:hypothetical protein CN692_19150 [Bacillus sp. AFS002410]|uniref:hypothetical protein n=1 Tax=Bacillus sp. AFS002410 TaxID=2033481 RepID=UPI000BF17546|nr:hypothetical protein [Bacillus sp. AFS002410]PEJ56080.1 hypothetical protein CN692_19150 [Bacillus sp. AFS002410]
MKRQYKPNNKVKHFENKAKRYLAIGKWHESRYENAVIDIQYWAEGFWKEKRKNDETQERLDKKSNDHDALYSQFHGLRNEYFEQNDELRRITLENEWLDKRFNLLAEVEHKQIKEIIELKSKLGMRNKQFIIVGVCYGIYVAFDIISNFI